MFTKKVTDDDNFMSLSASAQALYLHLSMSADDDGFSNQVAISMFKAHASVQDLEALLNKRYIYQFENGVIVIKHWRMANALRKDRYTPTVFKEELAQLQIKENGSYTRLPNGCQVVAERLPQDRLDKVSLDKDSKGEVSLVEDSLGNTLEQPTVDSTKERFEYLWDLYPNKKGKKQAFAAFQRAVKKGTSIDTIREGIKAYNRYIKESNIESKYIKQGSTFFQQEAWNDDWTPQRPKGSVGGFLEDLKAW